MSNLLEAQNHLNGQKLITTLRAEYFITVGSDQQMINHLIHTVMDIGLDSLQFSLLD